MSETFSPEKTEDRRCYLTLKTKKLQTFEVGPQRILQVKLSCKGFLNKTLTKPYMTSSPYKIPYGPTLNACNFFVFQS